MPKKNNFRKKVRKDRKQDKRLKKLENLVYKTIENKQCNYHITPANMTSAGYATSNFIRIGTGPEDGKGFGDPARIGNTVTLYKQQWGINFVASSTDTFNQIRCLIVESKSGSNNLALQDVLQYYDYTLHGDNVFTSPYTTKNRTDARYKVHLDKTFCLSGLVTKGGVPPVKSLKPKIHWKQGKLLEFEDETVKNPSNFVMNLFVITDSVSASHPTMSYNVRSTYKDA